MARLKNKVAVVLGASSIEGLGGVIAKTYANEEQMLLLVEGVKNLLIS